MEDGLCDPRWNQRDHLGGDAVVQGRDDGSLDQDRVDGDGVYGTVWRTGVYINGRAESKITPGIVKKKWRG